MTSLAAKFRGRLNRGRDRAFLSMPAAPSMVLRGIGVGRHQLHRLGETGDGKNGNATNTDRNEKSLDIKSPIKENNRGDTT